MKKELFGSRKWGGSSKSSDYDYICDVELFNFAIKKYKVEESRISYSSSYESSLHNRRSMKFEDNDGRTVNLIEYETNVEYEKAEYAIRKVSQVSELISLEDRELRHAVCEQAFAEVFD